MTFLLPPGIKGLKSKMMILEQRVYVPGLNVKLLKWDKKTICPNSENRIPISMSSWIFFLRRYSLNPNNFRAIRVRGWKFPHLIAQKLMVHQIVRYCLRPKLLFLLSRFGMLYVLNHNFHYFTYRNITKFCGSILDWLL